MKPTFKTTALAILISLGAVACGSSGGGSSSSNNGLDKTEKTLLEQLKETQKAAQHTQEKLSQAQKDLAQAKQKNEQANTALARAEKEVDKTKQIQKKAEQDAQNAQAELTKVKASQTQENTEKAKHLKALETKVQQTKDVLKAAQERAQNAEAAASAALKAREKAEQTALLAKQAAEQAKAAQLSAEADKIQAVKTAEEKAKQAQAQANAAKKQAQDAKAQADAAQKAKESAEQTALLAKQAAEQAKAAQLSVEADKIQAVKVAEDKLQQAEKNKAEAEKALTDAQTKAKVLQAQLTELEKQAQQKEEALKNALADAKKWESKVPSEIRRELERTKDFIFFTRFRNNANAENFSTLPTKTADGDLRDFLFLSDDTGAFKNYATQENGSKKIYTTYRYHEDNAYIAEVFYDDFKKSVILYGGDATPAKALDTLKTKGEVTYDVHTSPGLQRNWEVFYDFVLKANFDKKTIHGQVTPKDNEVLKNQNTYFGKVVLRETPINTDNDVLSFKGEVDFYKKDLKTINESGSYQGLFIGPQAHKVVGRVGSGTTFIGNVQNESESTGKFMGGPTMGITGTSNVPLSDIFTGNKQ
ncbi:hypothetical protein HPC38_01260 [Pasteurellaceae bacterium HPA106]|uniref:hypothetical protein n=1 Tax=Spirabiliibacterium pneumoniae TaxID=221400 RepID=UPI001AAD6A34|nr:hypothetical protein [Spirabiliibacterium pneumoniae]MBE2895510.1 hypothetical protein [Spirabiliibacterium pneumoniae]